MYEHAVFQRLCFSSKCDKGKKLSDVFLGFTLPNNKWMNAFLQDKTSCNQSPFQVKQVLSSICNDTEQLFQASPTPVYWGIGKYWNLINWSINVVSYAQIALQSMHLQVGTHSAVPSVCSAHWLFLWELASHDFSSWRLACLFRGWDLFHNIVFCTLSYS